MGRKLLDAYHREFKDDPPPEFYPDRPLVPEVRQRWHTEGEAWCKRRIVERCLFGVDLNPTAVQLAQVALWIKSLAGDRPLSFFAHHIRSGNSLLGTWLDRLHQPPHPALDDKKGRDQGGLFEIQFKRLIREALDERLLIDKPLPPDIRKDTSQEYEYKADRLKRSNDLLAQARLLFDLAKRGGVRARDLGRMGHTALDRRCCGLRNKAEMVGRIRGSAPARPVLSLATGVPPRRTYPRKGCSPMSAQVPATAASRATGINRSTTC
jgi:hypothetical protein